MSNRSRSGAAPKAPSLSDLGAQVQHAASSLARTPVQLHMVQDAMGWGASVTVGDRVFRFPTEPLAGAGSPRGAVAGLLSVLAYETFARFSGAEVGQ